MSQNERREKDLGAHDALDSISSAGSICTFKIALCRGEKFLSPLSFDCFFVFIVFSLTTFLYLPEVKGNGEAYNKPTFTLNLNLSLYMGSLMKV